MQNKLPSEEAEAFCAALRDNGLFPVTCDARIRSDATRIAVQGFELVWQAVLTGA